MFDSACLEFIIGDPLISVEALKTLRDVLNTLPASSGKCGKPLLNTFREGETHESSEKPAPAAESEIGRSIADRGGRRDKTGSNKTKSSRYEYHKTSKRVLHLPCILSVHQLPSKAGDTGGVCPSECTVSIY
jgi:hypothetical protein